LRGKGEGEAPRARALKQEFMPTCGACGEDLGRKEFSASQLKRKSEARCKSCVAKALEGESSASAPQAASFDALFANLIALNRVSEAEYDRCTDMVANGKATEAELVAEWSPLALDLGAAVTLKGLKGRAELNGRPASVVEFQSSSRRFVVKLEGGGETIAVKRDNLDEATDAAALLAERLGPDLAGVVSEFLTCTRCCEPCAPGSKCRVPHPAHMREELGMMSGPQGVHSSFGCRACGEQYQVVTPWVRTPGGGLEAGEPRIEGPRWCYAGVHTTQPLPASDKRRVSPHTIALTAGPRLQAEIDALPADVVTLTISSGSGFYDEGLSASLERHLPDLTELQLVDVAFERVVLSAALTPSLRHLRMQNVPDDCELTLELPELRSVSIHFLRGADEVVNEMLARATRLEKFDSYKLWVDELHLASNELVEVDLHRSDSLDTLTLYAPNLRKLGLQACYGLETLTFRASHPTLSAQLPPGHTPPPLEVNTTNANLGAAARRALRSHPHVVKSRTRHQGMPTEAMFAGMGGMMGGMMGGDWDDNDDDDEDNDECDDEYDDDDDDDELGGFGADGMPAGFAEMMMAMGGGAGMPPGGMPPEMMQSLMAMMQSGMDSGMDSDEGDEEDEGFDGDEEDEDEPPPLLGDDDDESRIEEIDPPS
jgi:hypothetical protein